MSQKINLLILVKNLDGGTGTFVLSLIKIKKYLKRKKINIKLLCLEKPSCRKTKLKIDFVHGEKFYPTNYSFLNSAKHFILDTFYIKNFIKSENPDLIISINYYSNLILAFLNRFFFLNKIIIFTFHNDFLSILNYKSSLFLKISIKFFFSILFKNTYCIAVSKNLTEEIKKITKNKEIRTIYNGIKIYNNTTKVKKQVKKNALISISRFDRQKDFLTLFKSLVLLKKRFKKFRLLLIGDGVEKNQIKKIIRTYYLSRNVFLLKWKNNVFSYLKRASLFLLSSNYEGFGYVILEAMSQGLPIISTDTPFGPREILDNGKYGILVPMKNPQAMAEAMYELLTDEKKYRYYSQKSLERVKYFSLDKMLKAYKKVILDLINKQ